MFQHWAQPVTSKSWAIIAVVAHTVSRATGFRILASFQHTAWERATAR